MNQCWACHYPVDVDESTEGHSEIHKECLLELQSNGNWVNFRTRIERRKAAHLMTVARLNQLMKNEEGRLLATA